MSAHQCDSPTVSGLRRSADQIDALHDLCERLYAEGVSRSDRLRSVRSIETEVLAELYPAVTLIERWKSPAHAQLLLARVEHVLEGYRQLATVDVPEWEKKPEPTPQGSASHNLKEALALFVACKYTVDYLRQWARDIEAYEAGVGGVLSGAKGQSRPARPKNDIDYKTVQGSLLAMRDRGEKWSSYSEVGKRLGCSDATIRKAIAKDESGRLQEWVDQSGNRPARSGSLPVARECQLAEVSLDQTAQTGEPDPAEAVECDDPDTLIKRLIVDPRVSAAQRAQLQGMPPDQLREIAQTVLEDPEAVKLLFERQ